ncbi:hypothetical protein NLG97_g11067 [Lecanicillium saksenae]|uniref:Uncharacterized protein n=1 Tax=Lecanicillium saksenae TaxID=468837 RepID=A0ACC1QBM3_9HYPO|nr:hypothetical protein NLG97_g11067 [Lecanicillium saksenae]
MSGAFSKVLSMLGMGSAAEPAELSEAYKRACRYIYYRKLCDKARFAFGMNSENGEPLPVYLEGSTMKQVQDSVVKALAAFEEHGEVSLLDKFPLLYLYLSHTFHEQAC